MLPDYGGACLTSVVPTLIGGLEGKGGPPPDWLPEPARRVDRVVLLVLDGLGWEQLVDRATIAPAMSAMEGGPITSVVPTTTATALTSLTTGCPPAEHGVVGYRVRVGDSDVLNILRWRTSRATPDTGEADARSSYPPAKFQPITPFLGEEVPVISRSEFGGSGFSVVHLRGSRHVGWRMPSSIRVEVMRQLSAGARFVYAYYDGIDKVAHETGLGEHFDAELAYADRLVDDLASSLPSDCALVVTADHGQVFVPRDPIVVADDLMKEVDLLSGEGRFRWLHVRREAVDEVAAGARERYGDVAWVRSREETIEDNWFGGPLSAEVASRLGDVALVAREPVAFFDPRDTGELRLRARHGSLTSAEMLVPLLAARSN